MSSFRQKVLHFSCCVHGKCTCTSALFTFFWKHFISFSYFRRANSLRYKAIHVVDIYIIYSGERVNNAHSHTFLLWKICTKHSKHWDGCRKSRCHKTFHHIKQTHTHTQWPKRNFFHRSSTRATIATMASEQSPNKILPVNIVNLLQIYFSFWPAHLLQLNISSTLFTRLTSIFIWFLWPSFSAIVVIVADDEIAGFFESSELKTRLETNTNGHQLTLYFRMNSVEFVLVCSFSAHNFIVYTFALLLLHVLLVFEWVQNQITRRKKNYWENLPKFNLQAER